MNKLIDSRYKYFAFISYKREDERWAKWLQHKLENYRLPSNLNGRTDLPKEIRPVFKDTSELIPGNLPEQINEALEQSKYLIVICSPRSAQSEWVNKEIEMFLSMGRTNNIIPFIIEGLPFANETSNECFPLSIRQLPKENEILGANVNEMGRDAAAVKIVSRMFNIRFDELWRRREREQKRHRTMIIASLMALVLAISCVAFWMYHQKKETQRANWRMMENLARMVSEKAQEEIKEGNIYDAILALLELVPKDGNRPFVPEIEVALRTAYDSLQSNRWNYRYLGKDYYKTYFSDDGEYVVGNGRNSIDIYETKSLKLVSRIMLQKYQKDLLSYLSPNKDTLYLLDDYYILSYNIPENNLINEVPYSANLLKRSIGRCHKWNPYEDDHYNPFSNRSDPFVNLHWVKEWKKSVSLSEDVIILEYNPVKDIALLVYSDSISVNKRHYYNILYDCNAKGTITIIDEYFKDLSLYNVNDCEINSASFSPTGENLAITYLGGKGKIIDLKDLSWFDFNHGIREESLWLNYGYNGNLLKGSLDRTIDIYDGKDYTIVDSIPTRNVFSGIVQLNKNGTVCLVGPQIYYKHSIPQRVIEKGNFEMLEVTYADSVVDNRFVIYSDGENMRFSDKKGEFEDWQLSDANKKWGDRFYFFNDNKYVLIERLDTFYNDIINVETGLIVCQFPQHLGECYYCMELGCLAFKEFSDESFSAIIHFPSFDNLVSLCKKATENMELTKYSRRKFYLE